MKIKFDQPHFNGFTKFGIGDVVETDNAGGQYCIELGIAHEVPIETVCKKGEFVQEQYINCATPNPNWKISTGSNIGDITSVTTTNIASSDIVANNPNWFAKQTAIQSNKKN